jgi:hypothetical protein
LEENKTKNKTTDKGGQIHGNSKTGIEEEIHRRGEEGVTIDRCRERVCIWTVVSARTTEVRSMLQ